MKMINFTNALMGRRIPTAGHYVSLTRRRHQDRARTVAYPAGSFRPMKLIQKSGGMTGLVIGGGGGAIPGTGTSSSSCPYMAPAKARRCS